MADAPTTNPPSHVIEQFDGKVKIMDLELFVGYDPDIDDDDHFKKYDEEKIRQILARTAQYVSRGQHPRMILGHNSDENVDEVRPAIGEITNIRFAMIAGTPGIIADPVMSADDFTFYLQSNKYPRRSAEIWKDGFLSEVSLLGSDTPARPLPDTRFSKVKMAGSEPERFSRTYAACQFSQEQNNMADEKDKGKAKAKATADDDTVEKLKSRMQELEEENEDLKAQLKAKAEHDDEDDKEKAEEKEKDKNARRDAESERDTFKREAEGLRKRIEVIEKDTKHDKCEAALELMARDGYQLGDESRRSELLTRLEASDDPGKEVDFLKSIMARNPIGVIVDTRGVIISTDSNKSIDQQTAAANKARERCAREGKRDAVTFKAYYEEELEAA